MLVHRATDLMYANVLTKPLQGNNITTERDGITNWTQHRHRSRVAVQNRLIIDNISKTVDNLLQGCVVIIDIPLLVEDMTT